MFGVCLFLGGTFPRKNVCSGVQKGSENWAWFLSILQEWNVTCMLSHHSVLLSSTRNGKPICHFNFQQASPPKNKHFASSCFSSATQKSHRGQPQGWRTECMHCVFHSRADQGACHLTQPGMLFIDLKSFWEPEFQGSLSKYWSNSYVIALLWLPKIPQN